MGLLLFLIIYILVAIILKILINPPYRYRRFNLLQTIANVLLIPFMELVSGGKDSHWWDWEPISADLVDSNTPTVTYDSGIPKVRKFKRYPIVGQYNLSGARDLFMTIFILPHTVVLQPKDYQGDWVLLSRGGHDFDNKPELEWMICKFISSGPTKYLVDGKQEYLGRTVDGKYIELEVVDVISRYQHREYLFV